MRIALLFCLFLSIPTFANAPSMSLEAAARQASDILPLIKEMARRHGNNLGNHQLLFARDLLIGYYNRNPHARKANVVWLRIPKESKADFEIVLDIVMSFLDPERGAEHLRYETYKMLEPTVLEQKLREQRRHLVVFDDFSKFADQSSRVHQNVGHFDRINEYWQWMSEKAHARLTFFVIDEDGSIIKDENFGGRPRLDFIGTNYGPDTVLENGETIDYLGSEALHLKECDLELRIRN